METVIKVQYVCKCQFDPFSNCGTEKLIIFHLPSDWRGIGPNINKIQIRILEVSGISVSPFPLMQRVRGL